MRSWPRSETGIPHAENGAIVTFGAKPTEPNTQFGYIEADTGRSFADGASPIARFVEKPDPETAAEYVAERPLLLEFRHFPDEGRERLLDEMREFLPDSLDAIVRCGRRS